jgi:hypothetical protein
MFPKALIPPAACKAKLSVVERYKAVRIGVKFMDVFLLANFKANVDKDESAGGSLYGKIELWKAGSCTIWYSSGNEASG